MKKKINSGINSFGKLLIITAFLGFYYTTYAQTGVFYYIDKSSSNNNNKIVDIVEVNNSEICLLGKLTDNNYKNPSPFFLKIDKYGKKLKESTLNSESLYELNKLLPSGSSQLLLFGSQNVDGKYSPFNQLLDFNGIEKKSDYAFTVYSTLLGDIAMMGNESAVMVETKLGKSEKYSMAFHKINTLDNNKIWTKAINSKTNEESNEIYVTRDKNILILGKRYNADLTEYLPVLYKYTEDGEFIWSNEIDVPKNFYNQSVCTDKKENIYYICGYTKETTGTSETKIIKFTPDKIKVSAISLEHFSANGILTLSNNNFIIYGSNLKVHEGHVITKGKYVIMDRDLNILSEEEMNIYDKPDSELPKEVMSKLPTSSDFLTAEELHDGRIALGGRVFMPVSKSKAKNINSPRHNCAFLVLTDKNGKFRE